MGRGTVGKTAVIGMREKGGRTKASVIKDAGANSIHRAVHFGVETGSTLHTDEHGGMSALKGCFTPMRGSTTARESMSAMA